MKAQARNLRKQKEQERRAQRSRQYRCFWTWPFGHEYVDFSGAYDPRPDDKTFDFRCIECEKKR